MKKKYSLTYPAEEILRAHKKGRFKAFTIYGSPRVGKSVYGIKSGRDIYMALDGCDIDTAYEKALDCIKFDKKEVFGTIREHMRSNEILPLLIWDDTGVHGSGYQFFLNPMEVAALKGTMDTIGTGVSGLIMTTPAPGGILKFIRDYHFTEIEITQLDGEWDRKAQPREYYHSKRGWRTRKTSVYDKFSCYLPKWVWDKYITRRKEVALDAINEVLKVIDKQVGGSTGEDTKLKQIKEMTELKQRLKNTEISPTPIVAVKLFENSPKSPTHIVAVKRSTGEDTKLKQIDHRPTLLLLNTLYFSFPYISEPLFNEHSSSTADEASPF